MANLNRAFLAIASLALACVGESATPPETGTVKVKSKAATTPSGSDGYSLLPSGVLAKTAESRCDLTQASRIVVVEEQNCALDRDCPSGQTCACVFGGGYCRYADCFGPEDCNGKLCVFTRAFDCGPGAFVCQKIGDECLSDEDCPGDTECVLVDGLRACRRGACVN